MPAWQGRSKGTTLGYRIFVSILSRFGVAPGYLLLRFVALYYFLVSYKSSKPIYSYFRSKLGYSVPGALMKLYQNYYRFGQSIIDKVVIMAGMSNKFTYEFDGEENLHKIAQQGKGGLLLSAHLGNWEIAGHLLKRLSAKINIVMYDGEHQQIKQYMEQVTGKRNMNIIVIKEDLSHIYAISDAFKREEFVCMHADRFLEGNKTMKASLLGHPAKFPAGPFVLAATFRVPVSFVYAFKETNTHFHLYASTEKIYSNPAKNEMMQEMLNDYVVEMEKKVKQYPEQWFNYYDFWKQ
ncbi:MAG: lipid A biosynthesis acyltransferase [Gemmatimonadaceae bacterium]|nr:lipid A biosynthesis acyltransferase [Chitinophagaceae bacterium]